MWWIYALMFGGGMALAAGKDWFIANFGRDLYIIAREGRRDNCIVGAMGFGLFIGFGFMSKASDPWGWLIGWTFIGWCGGFLYSLWEFKDRLEIIQARRRLDNPPPVVLPPMIDGPSPIARALPAPAAPVTIEQDGAFGFDPARFGKTGAVSPPPALPRPAPMLAQPLRVLARHNGQVRSFETWEEFSQSGIKFADIFVKLGGKAHFLNDEEVEYLKQSGASSNDIVDLIENAR